MPTLRSTLRAAWFKGAGQNRFFKEGCQIDSGLEGEELRPEKGKNNKISFGRAWMEAGIRKL
jgi:hypothetical protein